MAPRGNRKSVGKLAGTRRQRAGRFPHRFDLRMPEPMAQETQSAADRLGISVADYCRMAIAHENARHAGAPQANGRAVP